MKKPTGKTCDNCRIFLKASVYEKWECPIVGTIKPVHEEKHSFYGTFYRPKRCLNFWKRVK